MEDQFFQKYSKYSLVLFFLVIIALSVYLLFPFLTSIVAAAIIVYVFYPEFKKIHKHIKSRVVCSFIMVSSILLIVIAPIFLILNALLIEAANFYQVIKQLNFAPVSEMISGFLGETVDVSFYVKDFTSEIVAFIVRSSSDFFFSLPQKILVLFIIVFLMYYFFKDGDKIIDFFGKLFPIHSDHKNELLGEFNKVLYATIYGVLVTAVIQGLVGTLGLVIFDVSSPVIWGSVMVLTAMLPLIGTWIVWLPASLFKIFNGEFFNGFGLLLYGILIVSVIDNFIKPRLISGKSQVHPILIILGIFGGLKAFGIIGVMIGPLLLGVLSVFYNFYIKRLK